ncbi:hypothetical protein L1049_025290 [Liquidambar formosana]|uniref:TCP domain-containing protein n=1 Tax=Liquidambar formosana TaxID=63359 RepID=A0AAP0N807_LIQFO
MIRSSREKNFEAKQEGDTNDGKFSKAPSSSSRQWSGFRNPRIVRVSRSFGGKDRHSKVRTIRGLRDRRIRLSVPTAIQLYDLQDRLGLSQPSKVVDWLLDAAKLDIDKLPPLQMPQGNFCQFLQHELNAPQSCFAPFLDINSTFMKGGGSNSLLSSKEGIKINDNVDGEDQTIMAKSKYWDLPDATLKGKSKEIGRENFGDKTKWMKINEQENQDGIGGYSAQVSAQNFFPMANHSSLPGFLNNALPYNPYYHLEPSNLSLAQFGSHGFPSQTEDSHNSNAASQLPSSFSIPSGSQLLFCPSTTTPSLFAPFPPYISTPIETDPRQINHFQLLSSGSQHILQNSLMSSLHSTGLPMKSFPVNGNPKLLHSTDINESQQDKDVAGS